MIDTETTNNEKPESNDHYIHPYSKEDFLSDLEYLSDKALKYARSKSSINTNQKINQIRNKYGLDKRLL